MLLYHSPNFDGYTVENLIPYLAYVDKDGNIKDTMFDSFLFLLSGGFPSGLPVGAIPRAVTGNGR